jgi:hypothetical protein
VAMTKKFVVPPDAKRCIRITDKGTRCQLEKWQGLDVCKHHYKTVTRGYGRGKAGWVYVFDTGHNDGERRIVKIGRSADYRVRIRELCAGNPMGRLLFAGYVSGQARKVEAALHQRYLAHWVERELFRLSARDMVDIRIYLNGISSALHVG